MTQIRIYKCEKCGAEFREDRELQPGENKNPMALREIRISDDRGMQTGHMHTGAVCPVCFEKYKELLGTIRTLWDAMFPKKETAS